MSRRLATLRVLIVEDDPVVARLQSRMVETMGPFQVAGIASTGQQALEMTARWLPGLVLLDLTLRGMSGLDYLRRLRASGMPVEVIAVTAADDTETVRGLLHLGVLDYLVKPFSQERLHQALRAYLHRIAALSPGRLDQAEVDALASAGRLPRRGLPVGLSPRSLETVKEVLARAGCGLTAEEAAGESGLSRVTVRRYLEYLVVTQQATVREMADGPGRPKKVYAPLVPEGKAPGVKGITNELFRGARPKRFTRSPQTSSLNGI